MQEFAPFEKLAEQWDFLWKYLDGEAKQQQIQQLEARIVLPGFWDDSQAARSVIATVKRLKKVVDKMMDYREQLDDIQVMLELLKEMEETDVAVHEKEVEAHIKALATALEVFEIQACLGGSHDDRPAILSVHAGAGGTESCDWAEMLLRQYTRWAERKEYQVQLQDLQPGEEAGVSSATIRIVGPYAYGYAKAERGVHRLVRISPFDANARRHTSFCSVDVIAEIEDDTEVEVKGDDLRIDTFRSSGKGGQHLNKTDSAVRITHLPTNVVVTCQNERSQIKNRATALKMLKSRLYERLQDEKRAEQEKFYSEKGDIAWGNQIRSYVFQPYQMVKDLRTGVESGNVQAVMDGDIDRFIHAWMRAGCPSSRRAKPMGSG